uniref:Secreted protein n=1 Tax=Panstrongylus lignarius TaxID=156445 RepID=A0A224XWU2_9HEMI
MIHKTLTKNLPMITVALACQEAEAVVVAAAEQEDQSGNRPHRGVVSHLHLRPLSGPISLHQLCPDFLETADHQIASK